MRKIKSAPANLCNMAHGKKKITDNKNIKIDVPFLTDNKIKSHYKINIMNKKRTSTIHTALITDTYFEISKKFPWLDNYYINGVIDIINSFISNKLNKQYLENLIVSIVIRIIFSTIINDIIVKVNIIEDINIIK